MAETAGDNADPHPAPAAVPELMARLAAGDGVALFELLEGYRTQIRATVARLLHRLEARVNGEQLDELVAEAVLVVQEVAGSWRPDGGALPWVWAERRIYGRIVAYLGQYAVELDAERDLVDDHAGATLASREDQPNEWETLAALARRDERVALLHAALGEVTTMRQRTILLAYEALKSDGDPSPSHTLATELGLTPANVRQIVRRTKVKVDNLVRTDDRYASIRGLPILR